MKKFYFSLDKVLSLRTFYEKQAEIELQHATGKRDVVKIEIENIDIGDIDYKERKFVNIYSIDGAGNKSEVSKVELIPQNQNLDITKTILNPKEEYKVRRCNKIQGRF